MRADVLHSRPAGFGVVLIVSVLTLSPVQAEMIDTYLGMNFVNSTASVPEVQLQKLTYIGADGASITVAMPELAGTSLIDGKPFTGLPDGLGLLPAPTYTTISGGDGETTRTFGKTVAIDWDTSGAFPTIQITDIEVNVTGLGVWTAQFETPYLLGLIPATAADSELGSGFDSPLGDIYQEFVGSPGNTLGTVIATSAPPGYDPFIGVAFGEFIFSAAWAADPVEKAEEIITDVHNLNLAKGITSSLDAKLTSAIKAIEDNNASNDNAVAGKLGAFVNQVEAQSGKAIPAVEAVKLIDKAETLKWGGPWGRHGYGGYPG